MQRRRFSGRERIALFVAAGGRCSHCGTALGKGWHADHVAPWSRGGATDVLNGQALCATCNLIKGARVINEFRPWQQEAINKYDLKNGRDFLCSATPGAGKTTFALAIARGAIESGTVERIVVVVPTKHLRKQWDRAATNAGIALDPFLDNGSAAGEASDYLGCCVTYQQVAMQPDLHRTLCQRPTIVIFDEIHHAGDNQSWGAGLKHAFEAATRRLCLTGTPFRQDGRAIPFVSYDNEGELLVDASYSYGDALQDGAVRHLVFPSFEGMFEWWDGARGIGDDGNARATFAESLPRRDESLRLLTALDPRGDWMRDVIKKADERLLELRRNIYPAAAGLVVAKDQAHARDIASAMHSLIGVDPVVALSDDDDASRKIGDFGAGGAGAPRWMVAVKMVSEGVDIPRLFVGVWATVTQTELFFRQVIGRFVRVIDGVDDQSGYVFIPSVEPLRSFVYAIKKEIKVVLCPDDPVAAETETDGNGYTERGPLSQNFAPISSSNASEDEIVIGGDVRFSADQMQRVRAFVGEHGLSHLVDWQIALVLKAAAWQGFQTSGAVPPAHADIDLIRASATVHERKEQLRRRVQRLMSQYIQVCIDRGVTMERQAAYGEINRLQGVTQKYASEDQLKERIEFITAWMNAIRNGYEASHGV